MQRIYDKLMARWLFIAMMAVLCMMTSGCLRMTAEVGAQIMSGFGSEHSEPILVNDKYFDGTRHVAPLLLTPAAPIALIDLPLEFVWDVVLVPPQLRWQITDYFKEQRRLANRTLLQVICDRDISVALRRLKKSGDHYDNMIIGHLIWKDEADKKRMLPLIDAIFKSDIRFAEQALYDQNLLMGDNLEFYRYLFAMGLLSPKAFPREHAVYNAMETMLGNYVEELEPHLELVRLLLANGCNPNSVPYPNQLYPEPRYVTLSALDLAEMTYKREAERNDVGRSISASKCIDLLKSYGAKSGRELNLRYDLYISTLSHFFSYRDLNRFKERLETVDQDEMAKALWHIMHAIRWENPEFPDRMPFVKALVEHGMKYPYFLLCAPELFVPENMDFYEFMFENGLNPAEYPNEHAVWSCCYNIIQLRGRAANTYLEFLKLLLEKGCNPNSVPGRWCMHSFYLPKDIFPNPTPLALISYYRMRRMYGINAQATQKKAYDIVKGYGGTL